jgi:hypothetical protein
MAKIKFSFSNIINIHTSLLEERHLLSMSDGRFIKGSRHRETPKNEEPASLRMRFHV